MSATAHLKRTAPGQSTPAVPRNTVFGEQFDERLCISQAFWSRHTDPDSQFFSLQLIRITTVQIRRYDSATRRNDQQPMNQKTSGASDIDADRIAEHLSLVGLSDHENHGYAKELQRQVIQPNITTIIGRFHEALGRIDRFKDVIHDRSDTARLKEMHRRYLLTLGVRFQDHEYFEDRLRIGSAHQHVGVSLSLYQCTYRLLQSLLIEHIPQEIRGDQVAYAIFVQFILKITTLDMSLATEAYHTGKVSHLEQTVDAVRGEGQQLRQQLITDSLTSLSSRAFSIHALTTALDRTKTEKKPLCVIMADLDHFKKINDTFGHQVGDHVLCGVAARMMAGAREIDIIGRYGGDEFVFVLLNTDIVACQEIAERIRLKVNEHPLHVGNATVKATMSLGIAQARDVDNVSSLINRADLALYSAKLTGRDCVCVEDEGLETGGAIRTIRTS